MYKILLGVFFLFTTLICAQNDRIHNDVKKAIALAKETSLYRDTVNWEKLEAEVLEKTKNATSHLELETGFNHLLTSLKDHHGIYLYDNKLIGNYVNPNDVALDYNQALKDQIKLMVIMLGDATGYVRLENLPMGDNVAMSKRIRTKVDSLIILGAKKWIVDLRYNMGGNMYPMLEGVAPILGEGNLGGTVTKDGLIDAEWSIKYGHFHYNGMQMVDLEVPFSNNKKYPVAVLISNYTASSGEVVATAFKGRPKTKFFGQHTRGMVTNNSWVVISEKFISNIATGYFVDRKGTIFKEFIHPDVIVPFKVEEKLNEDKAVQKALKWLK